MFPGSNQDLNPQYKEAMIPGDSKPYTFKTAHRCNQYFIDKQDTIYAHRADELFRKPKTVCCKGEYTNNPQNDNSRCR